MYPEYNTKVLSMSLDIIDVAQIFDMTKNTKEIELHTM